MPGSEQPAAASGGIDVQTAVRIAVTYFETLLQHAYADLAVEEVEKSDDGQHWLVTLGYFLPKAGFSTLVTSAGPRQYKVVKIDARNGEPLSMKIRNL